jgi:hypothetical protein
MKIIGTPKFMIVIYKQPLQMLEQTFPCHEQCEQLGITHKLHVTSTIKLLDEIIQFNGANPPPNIARTVWWLHTSFPCPQ